MHLERIMSGDVPETATIHFFPQHVNIQLLRTRLFFQPLESGLGDDCFYKKDLIYKMQD